MKRMFLWLLLIVGILVLIQIVYSAHYFRLAGKLADTTYARKTSLGEATKPTFKLFIAGDSVGAGVGASSFENSVAGRLGAYFAKEHKVNFENVSVSGHKAADVLNGPTPEEKQDLVVLIVSSNNLFRFTDINRFEEDVSGLFEKFSPLANKVVLIGPGRVFDSQAVPLVMRPIYKIQGEKYAKILREEAVKYQNVTYVNPFEHAATREKYGYTLAEDKFHPNDSGHRFWFDLIVAGLESKTPGG